MSRGISGGVFIAGVLGALMLACGARLVWPEASTGSEHDAAGPWSAVGRAAEGQFGLLLMVTGGLTLVSAVIMVVVRSRRRAGLVASPPVPPVPVLPAAVARRPRRPRE